MAAVLLLAALAPTAPAQAATNAITSSPPPVGTAGIAYSHSFSADPPADRWTLSSGSLPPGLSLAPGSGVLSGTPSVPASESVTVQARWVRRATTVVTGAFHTCALLEGGAVKCWGKGGAGQLGQGDTSTRGNGPGQMGDALPAIDLGTGRTATAIIAGDDHTCALLDDGSVKCWGVSWSGRLGYGDTANRGDQPGEMGDALPPIDLGTGRTAAAITAGSGHTCALLDDGTVKCWGSGGSGQLGYGDNASRGYQPGQMGDALPAIDLGTGRTATAISAGGDHTCALLDDAQVKCWGYNYNGELGQGDRGNRGDQPGEMGDALPPIDLGTGRTATAVTTGGLHTCALLDDGTVKCWGNSGSGELGQGITGRLGDQPGEMGDALPPIDLGTGHTAAGIATGGGRTCALLDDGTVKCWGDNSYAGLGQGDTANRGDQPGEMGDDLPPIDLGTGRTASTVATGAYHACALLDDGAVKCWGPGWDGQLGLGDIATRGNQAGEMGDDLPAVDLGSTASSTQSFTLTVEGVSSMTPKAGVTSGGTEVTLTGVGFADVTGVRFGPTPAASFTVIDDTTITAVSPARPAGLVNVWLDSPGGSNANLAVTNYAYQDPPAAAPTITSVSPNIGDVAGGQAVTILGSGFLSATSVTFGQTPAASYTIVNDARIDAVTPPRAEALVNIWVTNPNGTNPNQPSSWYSYRTITGPPPTITALSARTGPTTGGQTLTITGTGFTGTIRVDFGPTTAPAFTVVNDTTIEVTTPTRPTGLVNVWVRTNNGANPNQMSSWYRYT